MANSVRQVFRLIDVASNPLLDLARNTMNSDILLWTREPSGGYTDGPRSEETK